MRKIVLTIRIEEDVKTRLEEIAKREDRTASYLIRKMILRGLEEGWLEDAPKKRRKIRPGVDSR